ncbi:hypothetical protein D9M70_454360 [compost metagenome]
MPRGTKLTELAGLFDLAKDVFEQITLGIWILIFQMEVVNKRNDLTQNDWIVDGQSRIGHEIHAILVANFYEEWKDLFAHEIDQCFTAHRVSPFTPSQTGLWNELPLRSRLVFSACFLDFPVAVKNTRIGPTQSLRLPDVRGVERFDHVEEEQKAELFGIGKRVGITTAI